jgi:hypothetical protein
VFAGHEVDCDGESKCNPCVGRMSTHDYPHDADGDALRRLAADGSDMSKPMEIDFAVAVPNEAVGSAIAEQARARGYEVEVVLDPGEDPEQDPPELDVLLQTRHGPNLRCCHCRTVRARRFESTVRWLLRRLGLVRKWAERLIQWYGAL